MKFKIRCVNLHRWKEISYHSEVQKMNEIIERSEIIRFMEATGLKEHYKVPSKILYSEFDGTYIIGLVIGYRTIKVVWKDGVVGDRKTYSYNSKHESFKRKTLKEAGF